MSKILRVKDLFHTLDERYGVRMSEVGLLDFLPSDYCEAFIKRDSCNHCWIFLKKSGLGFPILNCSISYNAPLLSVYALCSDFKLI